MGYQVSNTVAILAAYWVVLFWSARHLFQVSSPVHAYTSSWKRVWLALKAFAGITVVFAIGSELLHAQKETPFVQDWSIYFEVSVDTFLIFLFMSAVVCGLLIESVLERFAKKPRETLAKVIRST